MTRDTFCCFRIDQRDGNVAGAVETIRTGDLSAGNVLIRGTFSGINYKDALAATGAGKIIRDFPLIGGIDVAGYVEHSADDRLKTGDPVVVTGCGLGERHDGGFSQYVRVPSDWVVRLPDGLSPESAMTIGTAGFTAALAIERMELNGQTPDAGPILVTGATGGVGSFAIKLLSARGYRVTALTGKRDAEDYLRELGASDVLLRDGLEIGTRPLEKAQFAGAIDGLGGDVLSWLTRIVQPAGNIASIGLAQGPELSTTVMPFIIRGISLLGIDSVNVPHATRKKVWGHLAADVSPSGLAKMVTRRVTLDELPSAFGAFLNGTVTGRTLVDLQ